MKKCSYCGRENPDEATNCSGCGQDEFKVEIPPTVSSPTPTNTNAQKNLLLRVLIAVSVGIIISTISIYVAWINTGNVEAGWIGQWETQRALKDMGRATSDYRDILSYTEGALFAAIFWKIWYRQKSLEQ
jgi:hypothetical protein